MKDAYYESAADRFEHFYLDYSTDNNTPAHYHNSVEIIVVAEGEFTARGNGEERTLHTGDVFFADNYVTHVYKTAFHSETYVIVLSDAYLKNFHTRYGGTFPMFMYAGEDKNARLLSLLASAAEDWNTYNALMKHGLADWILGYLADRYPPTEKKNGEEGRFIAEVLQYIDAHFAEELSVASLAEKFGYSPNYFSSLFNRFTDSHFRDYLNRIRLRETEALMKAEPDIPAGKAAMLCGFVSQNTYYRTLRSVRSTKETK